jgi:hypothetical protein
VRRALPALALLGAGWAATFLVGPFKDESVTDIPLYSAYAELFLHGALPYRDVAFEYPPLAAPVIALAGVAGDVGAYRVAFGLGALAVAGAMVLLCGTLAARTGGDRGRAMLAAAAAPLLCGAMIRTHFDLVPVTLTLGALALLCVHRPRAGLAVLGVAVAVKLYPIVVLPVALAWLLARGERRAALEGTAALVLVVAVAYGTALALSPSGTADSFTYHLDRPVQVESSPAVVLRALDAVGAGTARPNGSHRSDGLDHSGSGAVTALFLAVMAGSVALLALGAAERRDGEPPGPRALILAGLGATVAFAVFGKVLSPQFLVWVVPLFALAVAWRMPGLALLSAAAIVLTHVEFPAHYDAVVDREPWAVALVAVRDLVLAAIVAVVLRALPASRSAAPAPGSAGSQWRTRPIRPRPAPR